MSVLRSAFPLSFTLNSRCSLALRTFDIEPLGGVLSQGLIGYITMGVNMSANYEAYWDPLSGRQGMKQKQ